jgi:hypothetical protein
MSRDMSGERGEAGGGGAMRRLSREAAIGDSHAAAATATATTSSSRRVSSSAEHQHVAVATALTSSSQQQATRVATAASSSHLHAEDAGLEADFFWLRIVFGTFGNLNYVTFQMKGCKVT